MKLRAPVVSAVVLFVVSCASSYVPRANTHAEVRRYVERAARVVASRGVGACATFNTAEWRAGEYYIFVTNAGTAVTVCHPARPELVGRNEYDLQDANGKFFMREMLTVAAAIADGGWVEYRWARPGESEPTSKSTFVMNVQGPDGVTYLVGSGAYDMAP